MKIKIQTENVQCIFKNVNCYLHACKNKTVFVGLMMWGYVVVVKYFNLEYTVICTGTQVGYS